MSTAGPKVFARSWHDLALVVAGTKPGDAETAARQMAMIERRCPDVAHRCVNCGRVKATGGTHGDRCQQRVERLAGVA